MSNIKAIKNLTIYQDFSHSNEIIVNPRILVQPDVCIIRSISYCGLYSNMPGVFMIWSDLNNDFIGSFAYQNRQELPDPPAPAPPIDQLYSAVNVSPQTMIHITQLINSNSQIKFKIFYVGNGEQKIEPLNAEPLVGQLTGEFSMTMDFITYK